MTKYTITVSGSDFREGPIWLSFFLKGKYFSNCKSHNAERNHFCLDCIAGPLCPMGLQEHGDHRTLQIRRASHFDAVRVADIQKLVDIAQIQTYVINSAKIVFLLPRPQQRIAKEVSKACKSCLRSLADPVLYCSIGCKLIGIRKNFNNTDLSLTLPEHRSHPFTLRKDAMLFSSSCCDDFGADEPFPLWSMKKNDMKEMPDNTPMKMRKVIFSNTCNGNRIAFDETPLGHSVERSGSSFSVESFDSPPAPSTPQSRESGSLRGQHKRKGTPHRAPLV